MLFRKKALAIFGRKGCQLGDFIMKKIITIFLNLILSFCFLMPTLTTVNADEPQGAFALEFTLEADGGQSIITAAKDDVITVSFRMKRTDSNEEYVTNGFQNYIHYDLSFFELVEDSIVCYDTGNATAKKQTSITYGEIIQCQNMGKTYASDFVFCTFELKVIGTSGSGMIYNDEVYVYDASYQEVLVVKQNLQVQLSACKHANKIKVAEKKPTCDEDGWNAYCYCEDCGLFFDENGKNLIATVPFIEGKHKIPETMSHDENGHWYECTACGEKLDAAVHSGGTATCVAKAKCEICEQEYGEIDAQNHSEKTYTKNAKTALPWENGYTGDVYCSECDELIQLGEVVSSMDFVNWPWWIFAAALVMLLLIIVLFVSK